MIDLLDTLLPNAIQLDHSVPVTAHEKASRVEEGRNQTGLIFIWPAKLPMICNMCEACVPVPGLDLKPSIDRPAPTDSGSLATADIINFLSKL